eukprot:jgi/Psemu1/293054/fgenesh1_pg.1584_\
MYVRGEIPDYQLSAWLMAVCFCPLTPRETATLTRCYAESGTLIEWPATLQSSSNGSGSGSSSGNPRRRPPLVDKHSSGGVGDKISLVLAPLVATCGVAVPMIAGRGLGHTGGTIDKLETSFPGYKAEQTVDDFRAVVLGKGPGDKGVGCAIVAAGPELCPADRKIYALRDVTSTVSCLPLQTASIMSKKIAERPDSLVLDVKHGDGAFQPTVEDARLLAESMVAVGEANGVTPTTAFLTDMNHPIGRAVGNWVEIEECIDVMKGNLTHDRLRLGRDLIALQYARMSLEECIRHAHTVLDSGRVLETFRRMLLAQGAEPTHVGRALDAPASIPLAAFRAVWEYRGEEGTGTGVVARILDIPAKVMGNVAVLLGAGRIVASDDVDGQAGLVFGKQTGDVVADGDVVVTVYTNRSQAVANAALDSIRRAVRFEITPTGEPSSWKPSPIVTHRVTKEGGTEAFAMPEFLVEP